MENIKKQIIEIINREKRAWDTQNIELLMSILHLNMAWSWPRTPQSHDLLDWVLEIGRYNYEQRRKGWQKLFNTHRLAYIKRDIKKIVIS